MSGSNVGPSTLSQTEAAERDQVERIRQDIASGRFARWEALHREQVRDNAEAMKLRAADQVKSGAPAEPDLPARTLTFSEDKKPTRYADLKAEHAAAKTSELPTQEQAKDQPAGGRTLAFHEDHYPDQDHGHSR